jgi:ankyrin repeat protein
LIESLDLTEWLKTNEFESIESRDAKLAYPIHLAVEKGNLAIAQALVLAGTPYNVKDGAGNSIALIAAEHGRNDILEWVATLDESLLFEINGHGDSPMTMAIFSGNMEAVKWLYARGASLTTRSHNGFTHAMIAAENNRLDALKWLVSHGCSVFDKDTNRNTPLILAANAALPDIVRYLIDELGAVETCDFDGLTPLMLAASKGSLEIVKMLWNRSDIHAIDNDGENVGHKMAESGNLELLRFGLENGLKSDVAKVFCGAICGGHVEIVDMLVKEYGFSLDMVTKESIMRASVDGHLPLLEYLHEKGLKWSDIITDGHGALPTLLYFGLAYQHLDLADWVWKLLKEESGIDDDDSDDNDVLEIEPRVFQESFFAALSQGRTASLDWMVSHGLKKELLEEYMHDETRMLLILAVGHKTIDWLLDAGWDVSKVINSVRNPLNWPNDRVNKPLETLKRLIKLMNLNNWELNLHIGEYSPLTWALSNGFLDCAKYLIEVIGVTIYMSGGREIGKIDPLLKKEIWVNALQSDDLGVVKWLIHDIGLRVPNLMRHFQEDQRYIDCAINSTDIEVFIWCYEYMSSRKDEDNEYWSDDSDDEDDSEDQVTFADHVLRRVLLTGQLEVLKYLVEEQKVDINMEYYGYEHGRAITPVMMAANASLPCLEYLYEMGADLFNPNAYQSLSHFATEDESVETLKWLKKHGALNVKARSPDGLTCLMVAARANSLPTFLWLLKQGAPLNDVDYEDYNVLQHANAGAADSIFEFCMSHQLGYMA